MCKACDLTCGYMCINVFFCMCHNYGNIPMIYSHHMTFCKSQRSIQDLTPLLSQLFLMEKVSLLHICVMLPIQQQLTLMSLCRCEPQEQEVTFYQVYDIM